MIKPIRHLDSTLLYRCDKAPQIDSGKTSAKNPPLVYEKARVPNFKNRTGSLKATVCTGEEIYGDGRVAMNGEEGL